MSPARTMGLYNYEHNANIYIDLSMTLQSPKTDAPEWHTVTDKSQQPNTGTIDLLKEKGMKSHHKH